MWGHVPCLASGQLWTSGQRVKCHLLVLHDTRSEPVHSFVRVQLTILLLQTSYFNTPAKRVIKHFLVTRRTNVVRDSNSGEMGKFKHLRVLAGPGLGTGWWWRCCCYIKVSMLLSSSLCSAPYQTCKRCLTRPRLFISSYSYSEALSDCQLYNRVWFAPKHFWI